MGAWVDARNEYQVRDGGEVTLPEGLRLAFVWTSLDGLRSEGEAFTRFRPQGDATQTYVHLDDDRGREYTIEVSQLLGKPRVEETWTGPR